MARPTPNARKDYPYITRFDTRWNDNDVNNHLNNNVYFGLFDTTIGRFEMERGILSLTDRQHTSFVVEQQCNYFGEISFPDTVWVGLRMGPIGSSSMRYEMAVFKNDEEIASAQGHSVFVYVDKETHRPKPIPDEVRRVIEAVQVNKD